ncbi:uncharacterized protein LOC123548980 [Mercenaria mercenaria]|uniref:uncharacterized protein LOC123548980 n=1 Tax=Mercenaria mercenaria TaxID=6596 RepID=UPI001E1D8C95|nr:uncharacterized protein LOC123548980 [Mercenaria mercenaria]XP_045192637.1 uncharacterized protein LOC123548980 [Mercenaria mercenaria]
MKIWLLLIAFGLVFVSVECSYVLPPILSLSEFLWQKTVQQHQAALTSSFIQGLVNISLDPTSFGAYMVQDPLYCYIVNKVLDFAATRVKNNPELKEFFEARSSSCEMYYKALLKEWHISNVTGISAGTAIVGYLKHLYIVPYKLDPIYVVVALIPRARLWPWLGGQIDAETRNFGVYSKWVTENLNPGSRGYEKYEAVINNAAEQGLIDSQKALQVYTRSMQGEVDFFSSV